MPQGRANGFTDPMPQCKSWATQQPAGDAASTCAPSSQRVASAGVDSNMENSVFGLLYSWVSTAPCPVNTSRQFCVTSCKQSSRAPSLLGGGGISRQATQKWVDAIGPEEEQEEEEGIEAPVSTQVIEHDVDHPTAEVLQANDAAQATIPEMPSVFQVCATGAAPSLGTTSDQQPSQDGSYKRSAATTGDGTLDCQPSAANWLSAHDTSTVRLDSTADDTSKIRPVSTATHALTGQPLSASIEACKPLAALASAAAEQVPAAGAAAPAQPTSSSPPMAEPRADVAGSKAWAGVSKVEGAAELQALQATVKHLEEQLTLVSQMSSSQQALSLQLQQVLLALGTSRNQDQAELARLQAACAAAQDQATTAQRAEAQAAAALQQAQQQALLLHARLSESKQAMQSAEFDHHNLLRAIHTKAHAEFKAAAGDSKGAEGESKVAVPEITLDALQPDTPASTATPCLGLRQMDSGGGAGAGGRQDGDANGHGHVGHRPLVKRSSMKMRSSFDVQHGGEASVEQARLNPAVQRIREDEGLSAPGPAVPGPLYRKSFEGRDHMTTVGPPLRVSIGGTEHLAPSSGPAASGPVYRMSFEGKEQLVAPAASRMSFEKKDPSASAVAAGRMPFASSTQLPADPAAVSRMSFESKEPAEPATAVGPTVSSVPFAAKWTAVTALQTLQEQHDSLQEQARKAVVSRTVSEVFAAVRRRSSVEHHLAHRLRERQARLLHSATVGSGLGLRSTGTGQMLAPPHSPQQTQARDRDRLQRMSCTDVPRQDNNNSNSDDDSEEEDDNLFGADFIQTASSYTNTLVSPARQLAYRKGRSSMMMYEDHPQNALLQPEFSRCSSALTILDNNAFEDQDLDTDLESYIPMLPDEEDFPEPPSAAAMWAGMPASPRNSSAFSHHMAPASPLRMAPASPRTSMPSSARPMTAGNTSDEPVARPVKVDIQVHRNPLAVEEPVLHLRGSYNGVQLRTRLSKSYNGGASGHLA